MVPCGSGLGQAICRIEFIHLANYPHEVCTPVCRLRALADWSHALAYTADCSAKLVLVTLWGVVVGG